MKIAAAVIALAQATQDPDQLHCWPANDNAPFCGCQYITREKNMVNQKCTFDFDEDAIFGQDRIQMFTVASSFPLPERDDSAEGVLSRDDSSLNKNRYVWTGFETLSHENLHDIVWFFRPENCRNEGHNQTGMDIIDLEAFERYEGFTFECEDIDQQYLNDSLPLLGNFNYDIARSHQSYNLPIYGLEADQTAYVEIESHHPIDIRLRGETNWPGQVPYSVDVNIRNVTAHHGHGIAGGNDDSCDDNDFQFTLSTHLGNLEYVNFYLCDDPTVSGEASLGDYAYNVPSSWTSRIHIEN